MIDVFRDWIHLSICTSRRLIGVADLSFLLAQDDDVIIIFKLSFSPKVNLDL